MGARTVRQWSGDGLLDDDLGARLTAFCRAHAGAGAEVGELGAMPGHSGLSFGFSLRTGAAESRHVLRLPPPGVRHEGPSDVLRQAAVLGALQGTAVPVPPVSWAGDDPRWFGRPYLVTEWLPGSALGPEDGGVPPEGFEPEAAARQAVGALAALHRLDAPRLLPGWEPASPEDDVLRWDRFAGRGAEPTLLSVAPALRERLLAAPPRSPRPGLRHGDYQWSNLLFHHGGLTAIVDWELASVGAVLHDLGWLGMFSDAEAWSTEGMWSATVTPARLAELYAAEGGDVTDLAWHRALAGYSFSVIAAFNLMLHRRGKRVDAIYERLALSIPRLLRRAFEVLDGAA
jgi:aminoglycoside phosphotransferase (APT) family kinase protein